MRDLRGSYKGISEFYLKILQNSGIMVDQRARNMALDLTILSFRLLKTQVTATSPMVEGNLGKFESHDSLL
jgi:hypothetical protein